MDISKENTSFRNKIPYMEKFMVPQMYDIFRFGGESLKDEDRGIQRMTDSNNYLRHFSKIHISRVTPPRANSNSTFMITQKTH